MSTEGWQLGIIQDVVAGGKARLPYTVNVLDVEHQFNVDLWDGNYTVDLEAPPLSRCFQMFGRTKSVNEKWYSRGRVQQSRSRRKG